MKLYATMDSSEGGRTVKKGSNDVLKIQLSNGNSFYGYITMNCNSKEIVIAKKEKNNFTPVFRDKLD